MDQLWQQLSTAHTMPHFHVPTDINKPDTGKEEKQSGWHMPLQVTYIILPHFHRF